MDDINDPPAEPDFDLVENLALSVRQNRPGHWAWDLRDSRDGSWFESIYEFDSPERAKRSGLSRLDELRRAAPATQTTTPRQRPEPDRVVVPFSDDFEFLTALKRLLAEGHRVEIVSANSSTPWPSY